MMENAKAEPVVPVSDLDRAASFYGETLGLKEAQRYEEPAANPMIRYALGDGTVLIYKSVGAGESRHTLLGFIVDDIEATVDDLRGRGVTFEEYDMGDIKTEDGIATIGGDRAAWFKDPDGNILGVGQYG
jgi:catechol 2,3-dioxygenase-like lactoylglutathione lyase family enzyme